MLGIAFLKFVAEMPCLCIQTFFHQIILWVLLSRDHLLLPLAQDGSGGLAKGNVCVMEAPPQRSGFRALFKARLGIAWPSLFQVLGCCLVTCYAPCLCVCVCVFFVITMPTPVTQMHGRLYKCIEVIPSELRHASFLCWEVFN